MAITMRVVAKEQGIALNHLSVVVALDRNDPIEAVFRSKIEFGQEISASDSRMLMTAASNCPVGKTLSKKIVIEKFAG